MASIALLLLAIVFGSEGYFGGADNITHYLMSRYAFRHPELFLNAWGRPLFTILSSPFAQLGLTGIKMFNILAGLTTAWLAFRISCLLNLKNSWMAPILVIFTPLYLMMLPTALTEIIFSLDITLALFLFIRRQFCLSAIVISFLPFARTEGFIMLPLWFMALGFMYLKERKSAAYQPYTTSREPLADSSTERGGFRLTAQENRALFAIPFLSTGILFFSLAGAFHYSDLFWVFTQFPYPVNYTHPIYNETGSLWHFVNERNFILGAPLQLLFITGTVALAADFLRSLILKHRQKDQTSGLLHDHSTQAANSLNNTDGFTPESQPLHSTGQCHDNIRQIDRAPGVNNQQALIFWLALAPFLLYLAFHSILYWKAMGGSMGLTRVMAAMTPLAAIVAMKGVDALTGAIGCLASLFHPAGAAGRGDKFSAAAGKRKSRLTRHLIPAGRIIIALLLAAWVIITPFRLYRIPHPLSPEEISIREATAWLKNSPYSNRFVFYADQNVPFCLGIDPFEKPPQHGALLADVRYLDTIPPGSLLIWDAHFGANESKIPIDSLLSSPRQRLLHWVEPAKPWETFGGTQYFCCITGTRTDLDPGFRKFFDGKRLLNPGWNAPPKYQAGSDTGGDEPLIKSTSQAQLRTDGSLSHWIRSYVPYDNFAIRDSLLAAMDALKTVKTLYRCTFENSGEAPDTTYLTSSSLPQGNKAFIMDGRTEFSPGMCCQPVADLPSPGEPFAIRASARINVPEPSNIRKIMLVISFEHNFKSYSYTGLNITEPDKSGLNPRPGKWRRVSLEVPLPAYQSPADMLKVYIWNPEKALFFLDDLSVEVITRVID